MEVEAQLTALKQVNEHLVHENNSLKSTNQNFSEEVARLIQVDQELTKAQENLKRAENELATKEFQVNLRVTVSLVL